jgi:hypothetical protein
VRGPFLAGLRRALILTRPPQNTLDPLLARSPDAFLVHECGRACRCGPACGNCVAQRARDVPLEIFKTRDGRGWGVRAGEALPAGRVLGLYTGELMCVAFLVCGGGVLMQ